MNLILKMLFLICLIPAQVFAADDPNIPREGKDKIQIAMAAHINSLTAKNGGTYPIFDHDNQKIVQLTFMSLHKGVVIKGEQGKYYISCADFKDASGIQYDLDFLVSLEFEVIEALVYKKGDKKIHYGVL